MNAKVKPDAGKLLELATDYAVERSPDLLRVVANFANRDMMRDCIAREIARSHGGSLDVTSTEQDGTSFTMRLPRHSPAQTGQPILDEKHVRTM